jgi:hypothetical protein
VISTREAILALLADRGLRVLDEAERSRFSIVSAEKPAPR